MIQNFNFTLSSLPVLFYGLFDFEYAKSRESEEDEEDENKDKLYLMEHPLLYEKSMKGEYFSVLKFVAYLIYSLMHSVIIYFLCFYLMAPSPRANGKSIGLWLPGHVVFGTVVIVVNLVMVLRFSNYTGWGEALVYLMILCFPTLMYVESALGVEVVPELYFMFDVIFMMGLVWI